MITQLTSLDESPPYDSESNVRDRIVHDSIVVMNTSPEDSQLSTLSSVSTPPCITDSQEGHDVPPLDFTY